MTMTSPSSTLLKFSSSAHMDDMPQPIFPDMSTPKYDTVWKEYLDKATSFDKQIIEDWNKIVDVTLVFVGILR